MGNLIDGLRHFYPRPPRGGRLFNNRNNVVGFKFLSTPSARRATQRAQVGNVEVQISIHALREEGDDTAHRPRSVPADFYPRPPRGGRQNRFLPSGR